MTNGRESVTLGAMHVDGENISPIFRVEQVDHRECRDGRRNDTDANENTEGISTQLGERHHRGG